MIGVYDFCGHYEWTFAWLEEKGGRDLLASFWDEAIHQDSQLHAGALIASKGFAGMQEYWGHTLAEEGAACRTHATATSFRIDMSDCPSRGFLLRNRLHQYSDYCDHCMGWIGPMMAGAGFTIDHEHNHRGQCWWEFRKVDDGVPAAPPEHDIRKDPRWNTPEVEVDTFLDANCVDDKLPKKP